MQTLFVTGTDTNVGKTIVSCLLIRRLRESGLTVGAYKPACSGAELNANGESFWSDVDSLRAAIGKDCPLDLVCPQRFFAPVAPNVAAELERRSVSDELLHSGYIAWKNQADAIIVEGAGGIYCPLSNDSTVLDLAIRIKAPVVVVTANRLGVISHTRLTVEILRQSGLDVAAIILNEIHAKGLEDSSLDSNAVQLAHWIPDIALLHVEFGGDRLRILHHQQALTNVLLQQVAEKLIL